MSSPSGKYNTHVRFSKPWQEGRSWFCYEYVRSRKSTSTRRGPRGYGTKDPKTFRYKMRIRRYRGGKHR